MLNHDKFREKLVEILNEPIPDDEFFWVWRLQSKDLTLDYNFEVTIDREGKIYWEIHNHHEGIKVDDLNDTTEDKVVEKAKFWRSKVGKQRLSGGCPTKTL